jgi:predicted phosphoribosyltransferase
LSALDATYTWFGTGAVGNNDGVIAVSTAATIAAAEVADDNATVYTISTNVAAGTFADFMAGTITEAEMEAAVITAFGNTTTTMPNTDITMIFIDDGVNTGVFRFVSADGTANAMAASELEIMAVLVGVSNATTIVAADILFA